MTSDPDVDARREIAQLTAQLERERRARQHRMEVNQLAAQTSGEVSRLGVAEVIALGASEIFDAGWVMVAFVGDDEMIHFVHGPDVPAEIADDWQTAPLEIDVPIAMVLRGEVDRIALTSRADFEAWPIMIAEADRANMSSLVVEAVPGKRRPHAVVTLGWSEPHVLDANERQLLDELVEMATPVFTRAVHTEADRDMASTLQKWLLPSDLPAVDGLQLATMYEAGREAMSVGGDWYDVVSLEDGRSAIVIGDVVGHDVRAVAEMAQVRHVLAAHLMVTGDPAESLSLTDRYLHQRASNTMATALVMLVDRDARTIELASGGHLSPVLARIGQPTEVIPCGLGPPIGSGLGGYGSHQHDLPEGAVCVAVTDGVVELRGETIDKSMFAFCHAVDDLLSGEVAAGQQVVSVEAVIDMLRMRVSNSDGTDDAAAVVFRSVHE
ncbi:MAG: SpoIIE family protein phosphatase [Ilumatobacter sp.]|uniref:PP2C family protein-serine/threonine phosphatase n=1 Tax=Ilumatobacter sp. TaxID=1967498 RepID=UPI003C71EEF5